MVSYRRTALNTITNPDPYPSYWHYLYTGVYATDVDETLAYDGDNIVSLKTYYEYTYNNNGNIKITCMFDHKYGEGDTVRNGEWSAMDVQNFIAENLDLPFFMSLDYLHDKETPCSFWVPKNKYAEYILAKYNLTTFTAGAYTGVWMSPYDQAVFLHKISNKPFDTTILINPLNENGRPTHFEGSPTNDLIKHFKMETLGDLPKGTFDERSICKEDEDGTNRWYLNDNQTTSQKKENNMCNNEPICEIDEKGNKFWHLNGQLHRVDGPAIESANGNKHWYLNGKRHRVDGPAVERAIKCWYVDGEEIEVPNNDNDIFLRMMKLRAFCDF